MFCVPERAMTRGLAWLVGVAALFMPFAPAARAVEITVKNDSFISGGSATVQAGFVAGESAAAWLTSPCTGQIVAVQVAWLSTTGGTPQSIEDSITIFSAGTFPNPGPEMINAANNLPAILEAPLMTDGALNEFRFVDQQNSIPLLVNVTAGQVFVVSFKFLNSPDPNFGPSVITDVGSGCQNGKNGLFAIPPSLWFNSCALGVTGDFVIRAVVNCPDTGACCINSVCSNNMTQAACVSQGGTFLGAATTCNSNSCRGACCVPSTQTCVFFTQIQCTGANGTFQGIGTSCANVVCFPIGACCLPNGSCLGNQSPGNCTAQGGVFQGNATTCASVSCPIPNGRCCVAGNCIDDVSQSDCAAIGGVWGGPLTTCAQPNACTTPCPADIAPTPNGDGFVNVNDLLAVINGWGPCAAPCPPYCRPDIDHSCVVNVNDLLAVINSWGPCP